MKPYIQFDWIKIQFLSSYFIGKQAMLSHSAYSRLSDEVFKAYFSIGAPFCIFSPDKIPYTARPVLISVKSHE